MVRTLRPKGILSDECGGRESTHEGCAARWERGSAHAKPFYCTCECHTPRATCNRCGQGGLSWAQFPDGRYHPVRSSAPRFYRNSTVRLVPTLFQPFSEPIKLRAFPWQSSARHICGIDVEQARRDEIEEYFSEHGATEVERLAESAT